MCVVSETLFSGATETSEARMDDIRIRREQYRTFVVWWWCRSWSMSLSAFFLMRRAGN